MQAGIADLGATIEKLQMSEPEVCLWWTYYIQSCGKVMVQV
jgi:hypothetical protein